MPGLDTSVGSSSLLYDDDAPPPPRDAIRRSADKYMSALRELSLSREDTYEMERLEAMRPGSASRAAGRGQSAEAHQSVARFRHETRPAHEADAFEPIRHGVVAAGAGEWNRGEVRRVIQRLVDVGASFKAQSRRVDVASSARDP